MSRERKKATKNYKIHSNPYQHGHKPLLISISCLTIVIAVFYPLGYTEHGAVCNVSDYSLLPFLSGSPNPHPELLCLALKEYQSVL